MRQFSSPMKTLKRRLVTIPALVFVTLILLVSTPVMVVALAIADVVRGRSSALLPTWLMLTFFCCSELVGLFGTIVIMPVALAGRGPYLTANYWLQRYWVWSVFRFSAWVNGMTLEFGDLSEIATGPRLLLSRHTSLIDTGLAPTVLRHFGIRSRYILKEALRADPAMDVVGGRVDMAFVSRRNRDDDLERIRSVCRDMLPQDTIILYPEGTRFESAVREKIVARFEANGQPDKAEYARSLRHTLPPRPAGTLAALDEALSQPNPPAVVFWAHVGFERAVRFKDVLNGGLKGATVRVRAWRVPASEVPASDEARIEWLNHWWTTIDQWVAENLPVP
ncbi:MAG: 1-acyl-sn-glycerol-3-phosphate acyltransferase [Myxococcota bacterium]